ncbi:MAG TPA: DUF1028 domain-containing protein [bacterium]|nr:DUF1028 domain-containing protein [bacterium]
MNFSTEIDSCTSPGGKILILLCLLLFSIQLSAQHASSPHDAAVATFSIVARDSATGEMGVAVASRFFAVGTVVPWAEADVGAVATQSFANTTFGWHGLELLKRGATPDECVDILLRTDDQPARRQFGIVDDQGRSATYTGEECLPWAGGRHGKNYAVQGNILTGKSVVTAMEAAFLTTGGTLSSRLYAALMAGEKEGGDARGKQSAALLVVKQNAGYGGYTDRAIDIRVDDHAEPFEELGRLLKYAQMNYSWNQAWTAFTEGRFAEALPLMERTADLAPEDPGVLYDLAVIRLANDEKQAAYQALDKAVRLNPDLRQQAMGDSDLDRLHDESRFYRLMQN